MDDKRNIKGLNFKLTSTPRYEFAGRPEISAPAWAQSESERDFSLQPWDSTCEAMGSSSSDNGMNLAQFELERNEEYTLEFTPREDGVALDAW